MPTEFEIGSLVLVSYLVRQIALSVARNNVIVRDLTNDARQEYNASRLRVFLVDPKAVITSDLCEAEVDHIMDHRGSAQKRSSLEFLVRWSDGDETLEKREQVKKLTEIDNYFRPHLEAKLKSLLQRK